MKTRIRCAVYTRKSSEEGLEQDFNSLDAQREAGEAFVRSQRSLGWVLLPARYDDGGISGGTMDRPALQALLADIAARKVDLVVVYKVDRLTRSLADFAKMVELFDAHGISFVSVTQAFNTSTSMGRLTLNVLLSFAQFEREVTGERIRDKIAASKKKGMWMGGPLPLGYGVQDRKLVVNPAEAETVRTIFRLYLELGTVKALLEEIRRLGLVTKRRRSAGGRETGGRPFTRGHLYQLLGNPLYAGEVSHGGVRYPGQHDAIVDRATFDAVHEKLAGNASERRSTTNATAPSLLAGLVRDETGDLLCPTHASKKGRRYRYYISKRLMHGADGTEGGWRLPAKVLEDVVVEALSSLLHDERRLQDALCMAGSAPDRLRMVLTSASELAARLQDGNTLRGLLHRVALSPDAMHLEIDRSGLANLLFGADGVEKPSLEGVIEYAVPVRLQRRGVEAKLVMLSQDNGAASINPKLVTLVSRAHLWSEQMFSGTAGSLNEIAARNGVHPSDLGRDLQLAFLAPDIVEAILDGRQPVDITAQRLRRIGALPLAWDRQRRVLGFPPLNTI